MCAYAKGKNNFSANIPVRLHTCLLFLSSVHAAFRFEFRRAFFAFKKFLHSLAFSLRQEQHINPYIIYT